MMEMLVWVLVIGLASYRVWRLIAQDSITEPLRDQLDDEGWAIGLVSCPWCLGSWVAFGATWLTDATIGVPAPVAVALGAAVVVGVLGEVL